MGESGDGGRVYASVVGGFEDELEDAMRWWRTCQALRPATMIRVGVVQFSPRLGQLQDNVTAVRDFCARFAPGSLDLLCLPEMVLTGYGFPNAAAIAPHLEHPKNGPTARLCAELATNLRCYVAAGYPERLYDTDQETGAIGANSGLLYDPRGNCITNYRKSNLYEMDKSWARAGTGFTTFNLPPPIGNLTLGICMDLNPFPPADWRGTEGPYELASHAWSNGTNVLVLLNSWLDSGHDPADAHDWHTLNYWAARLRPLWDIDTGNTGTRKQTLVVICNRTGTENGKTFAGTSAVLRLVHGSGKPQLLHMMGRREEGVRLWNIATRMSSYGTISLNDGNELPAIAFGTGTALFGKDATAYVEQALEAGFRHIDTAFVYRNEQDVGTAIRNSGIARSELFITTKFGGGSSIQQAARTSLSKLGLRELDLYLIHFPRFVGDDLEGAWREFEKIKDDGLSRSIGVSNFSVEELQRIVKSARIKPAVNQIPFHPYNYTQHKPLLEYAARHGIVIEAYSSLSPITKFPGGPVDAPINAAAKRLGATPTQVIMSWVRAKGVAIVTTSRTKRHLREYLAVPDLPPLTAEEIAAIDEAGARGPML